ncbi:MAG TPA: ATP-grasp domain-containing protein [Acidobacteriota bacterium]|nr:ATP-grasp domain-containing protein [Acidobacteriota bacterium]
MARLFEYQGKEILRNAGVQIPRGKVADSPEAAAVAAAELACPVVVKAQAWVTGRAGVGGIRFADTPDQAAEAAEAILGLTLKGFKVGLVLVEERLEIERECFAGIIIDDTARKPMLIVSSIGGSGIEEIAREHPRAVARTHIEIDTGLKDYTARNLLRAVGIKGKDQMQFGDLLVKLWQAARKAEARAAEVNPIVKTTDGRWLAADCHMTIDDYAVFRHPELGIEIAREFDRPATELEKIAYRVEEKDYRGTFYFIQLETGFGPGEGVIGFHGSGGGGSMMSMDALLDQGYKLANFCDTSGNPAASKVYRAARIILNQGPIDGYFLSGSGVASQEQFHSARGLVKAFREEWLSIPAVIRPGGNGEDKAVEILTRQTADLPAPVEGYKKHDTPAFCASRMQELLRKPVEPKERPAPEPFSAAYEFDSPTGKVLFDYDKCRACASKACVDECIPKILRLEEGVPVLAVTREDAARNKCIECLACELECLAQGERGCRIELPIPGLDEWLAARNKGVK